jgi:hypothetical protein
VTRLRLTRISRRVRSGFNLPPGVTALQRVSRWVTLLFTLPAVAATTITNAPEPAAPTSPREFYNAGTRNLLEGKLREAEAFLETALASQEDRLQPPTLYNFGHVRFAQGIEELKKGPASQPTLAAGRAASHDADEAIRGAESALASNEVDKMVAAYLRGRGVRKELKAATAAVRRAMEAYGKTLNRWQRAAGDFKSALELQAANEDAANNNEVVERCIAKLVDSLQEMQQLAQAMGAKQEQLKEKMKQLKGRIPEPQMPPGAAADDDEEEEDQPFGPQPGQKEGATKEGQEMSLSPEQAGWLLEGYKLDSERRLPMGQTGTAQPKDRSRPTW